ncbi:hypothetical protein ACTL6U_05025 [Rhodovibrionaceae bacterium A322]
MSEEEKPENAGLLTPRDAEHHYSMRVEHEHTPASYLNKLCDTYGTDKGETSSEGHPYSWLSHTYTDVYQLLFQLSRRYVKSVIECGVGTNNPDLTSSMGVDGKPGASLRMWQEYFPAARIIGLDIDKDILFQEDRIETYHCDQTDPDSIRAFIETAGIKAGSIDVIIDDGWHVFKAGSCFFANMIDLLAEDGFYIIEDVSAKDCERYFTFFEQYKSTLRTWYFDMQRPGLFQFNNRMIVISHL